MTDPLRRPVAFALLALLAACPVGTAPIDFSGKACSGASDCPAPWSCTGNLCELPDAGTNGGADAGPDGGGPVFGGRVALNGGATPLQTMWIYGQASPYQATDAGPSFGCTFSTTADSTGAWTVSGPATDGSYVFIAQYDLDGDGDSRQLAGDFLGQSNLISADQPDALNISIDVETSTCFSVTAELAGLGFTTLVGVGAQALDIATGEPFTALTTASANFDAWT